MDGSSFDSIQGNQPMEGAIKEELCSTVLDNWMLKHQLSRKINWTIDGFSRLLINAEKIYSEIFFAAGHKWQLLIFPQGLTSVKHLAMYLTMVDYARLPTSSCVQVEYCLGVLNQTCPDNTLRKSAKREFTVNSVEFGFRSLIPFTIINDETKGFMVNDKVVFEAEVTYCPVALPNGFRSKSQSVDFKGKNKMTLLDSPEEAFQQTTSLENKLELCSTGENQIVKHYPSRKMVWTIECFSRLQAKKIYSETISSGGYDWQIMAFCNNGENLGMCLALVDSASLPIGSRAQVKLTLGLVNQISEDFTLRKCGQHEWSFSLSELGFGSVSPLSTLYDKGQGYFVEDKIVLEAEVTFCQVAAGSNTHLQKPSSSRDPKDEASIKMKMKGKMKIVEELTEQPIWYGVDLKRPSSSRDPEGECSRKKMKLGEEPIRYHVEAQEFDKMASMLMEKLEDDKIVRKSVAICDFTKVLPKSYINVGPFRVPEFLKSYAEKILTSSEDVAADVSGVHYVNEMALAVLCYAVKSMKTTHISDVGVGMILRCRNAIRVGMELGFKVEYLIDDLRHISVLYLEELARTKKPFP
ncbi:hypothetical protein ACFE04_020920 [Oxalis oulophora]